MVGLVVAGTCAGSMAAEGDGANAALGYYRAWMNQTPELQEVLVTGGETLSLAAGGEDLLASSQETINALLSATRSGEADWDIAYEEGPGALLPHLGKMRASAKILAADALRCANAGDHAGAAQRAAALYRMSGQVSQDDILICSLVGMAISQLGNGLTTQLIDQGALDAAGATAVLTAIHSAPSDRFGMRDAIIGEWRIISESVLRNSGEEHPGAWLMEQIQMDEESELQRDVAAMTRGELLDQLGGFARYHSDMLVAWDAKDAEALSKVEAGVEENTYGMLTRLLGAPMSRAFASQQRFDADLEVLIGKLEGIERK